MQQTKLKIGQDYGWKSYGYGTLQRVRVLEKGLRELGLDRATRVKIAPIEDGALLAERTVPSRHIHAPWDQCEQEAIDRKARNLAREREREIDRGYEAANQKRLLEAMMDIAPFERENITDGGGRPLVDTVMKDNKYPKRTWVKCVAIPIEEIQRLSPFTQVERREVQCPGCDQTRQAYEFADNDYLCKECRS